ncbi:MAG: ComEC/Rec2 family competence protein [Rubrobacteraceae bacterium]
MGPCPKSRFFVPFFALLFCAGFFSSCGQAFGEADPPPPSGALTVSFIDVGQGDGILVQAGGENYLIDAGNPEEGPNVVDFLRSRGVSELDGMVSTSGDADHAGGLPDVLDAFPVENVYVSGYPKETMTYTNFLRSVQDEVQSEGAAFEEVRAGMQMDWAGVRVDVINPPSDAEGGLFGESNDNSVGLILTYGTARVLLAGDAEEQAEEYMASGPYTGPLTVLKAGHHGSSTSTTPLFLSRFPPRIAVIQCGADNSYGHPTPEVLERLRRVGAKVFRNDLHGDVIVTITSKDVEVAVQNP